MSTVKPRVLVVGGGLTSAALANLLAGRNLSLTVWDKARVPGGRMTTFSAPGGLAGTVDLGPQRITASPGYPHQAWYSQLAAAGLLRQVNTESDRPSEYESREELGVGCGAGVELCSSRGATVALDDVQWAEEETGLSLVRGQNYVAPGGVQAVVEHLFQKAGCRVHSRRPLSRLEVRGTAWAASSREGSWDEFDCVVTTLPAPQLLSTPPAAEGSIAGDWLDAVRAAQPDNLALLQTVDYTAVFCLGLFFAERLELPWQCRYFPRHPVVRSVNQQQTTSLAVQCQVGFSEQNKGRTKQEVGAEVEEAVRQLLPGLPAPAATLPHKWRYSQTSRPFPGGPGCVSLLSSPSLIAAGDSFTHSNMDGCLHSASVTAQTLTSKLNL